MDAFAVEPKKVQDISDRLLDRRGRLRVAPAHTLETTTAEERLLFGVRQGVYSFPTLELCEFQRPRLTGRIAIEIGAKHGVLAEALWIPATDNRQQENPKIRAYYAQIGQPTVPYGENVEKLDAAEAVEGYRPNVVVACWVTHRFDPSLPRAGGSETGVNEGSILESCDEYIFIGNEHAYAHKPIWNMPHQKLTPPWLYSRAVNGSRDFIAIWRRSQTPGTHP